MDKKELQRRLGELNMIIMGLDKKKTEFQKEANTIILKLEAEPDGNK